MASQTKASDAFAGGIVGILAYVMWGMAPIFWKLLKDIPAAEILAHRVVWALVVLALILTLQKRWSRVKAVFRSRRALSVLAVTTILIATNWFIFVYAVFTNRVLETSLGYFMNPLVNILLGFVFLKEQMRKAQFLAVALAACGVLYLAIQSPTFPWIGLVLAFSFAFYGLLHKLAGVEALPGLTVETLVLSIPGLIFLGMLEGAGDGHFGHHGWSADLILMATGLMTAVPLLCFGFGVRRVSLRSIGFMQYIAPSATFMLGVFVYGEPFTQARLVAFSCIWTALAIYSAEGLWRAQQRRRIHRAGQNRGARRSFP